VRWIVILAFVCRIAAADTLEDAERACANRDFRHALELFHDAAQHDAGAERRARSLARAANIEWRIFHDLDAARQTTAGATDAAALIERARAEADLAHDYDAARTFAARALAVAKKRDEKRRAIIVDAEAALTPVREARVSGRCVPADALGPVKNAIAEAIDRDGPLIALDRILLQCAILTNDRAAILRAWRWYYGALPERIPEDRRELAEALADAKFFDEAALVLDDPCVPTHITDSASREIVAYASATRRIRAIADEHYRQFSLGNDDARQFRAAVDALRLPHAEKRFRAVIRGGKTGGVDDVHYGHAVLDATYAIEQYGHKARLQFIAIDGMVSIGYLFWQLDGGGGSGGWNTPGAVYQIRPMYADGPIGDWLMVSDPEVRAVREKEIADESKRDETRDPLSAPRGTALRMRLQADDRVLADLKSKGLQGDALRTAFINRVRDDVFQSSIIAHEGRHAIDNRTLMSGAEREFRAKCSEVVFAPDPRRAITSGIFVDLDVKSAHGEANRRIFGGLTAWMRAHAPNAGGLAQFDRLTDAQMKEAFRSMDPLAK
jgi:hypothetical protein